MGYKSSGVDEDSAAKWVQTLQNQYGLEGSELKKNVISGIGSYAAVYAMSDNQWLATSCDGVGTKLMWTQAGLGSYGDLAQDLVAMNANDVLCVGAEPRLFLDYLAVGSKELLNGPLKDFVQSLFKICASTGQLLVGGETAQLPDLYREKDFDLAGFSIGFLNPNDYLNPEYLKPDQQVWAWPSSGPHSNGFTWLRRLYDSKADAEFISRNLMGPTRLYIAECSALKKLVLEWTQGQSQKIAWSGAYHITGTGLLNLLRLQPKDRNIGFDLSAWEIAVPKWILDVKEKSKSSWKEIYQTFNMGLGMCVILDSQFVQSKEKTLRELGLRRLGKIISQNTLILPDTATHPFSK